MYRVYPTFPPCFSTAEAEAVVSVRRLSGSYSENRIPGRVGLAISFMLALHVLQTASLLRALTLVQINLLARYCPSILNYSYQITKHCNSSQCICAKPKRSSCMNWGQKAYPGSGLISLQAFTAVAAFLSTSFTPFACSVSSSIACLPLGITLVVTSAVAPDCSARDRPGSYSTYLHQVQSNSAKLSLPPVPEALYSMAI